MISAQVPKNMPAPAACIERERPFAGSSIENAVRRVTSSATRATPRPERPDHSAAPSGPLELHRRWAVRAARKAKTVIAAVISRGRPRQLRERLPRKPICSSAS